MRSIEEIRNETEGLKKAIERCEIDLYRYRAKLDELSKEMELVAQEEPSKPENMIDGKICVSVAELAKLLGISKVKAYEVVSTKGFPALEIGRRIIIPVRQLNKWLEDNAGRQNINWIDKDGRRIR